MVELDISANSVQLDCSVDSGICVEGVTKDLKKKIQEFKRILFILERDKEAMRLLRERLSRIAERKIVKKKKDGQSVCNVCFTQIDTDDSKTCIACCLCAKNVCRGKKCSEWVPKDGEWRCQLCADRRDSYGKASTWVQEQYAVKRASLTEFSYPMRARSEIYIPLCDPNESAFLCNFESVSEVPSPINPNQKQHIREYIEEVLADMIGGSLKNATVEPISTNNMDYQQVRNGNELQGISNVRLRRLIESVIAETIRQPPFASAGLISTTTADAIDSNDIDHHETLPLNGNHCNGNGGQYFESKKYHDLLATAVLNKIVNTHGNGRHSESSPDLTSSSVLDNNHNTLNLNKTDESISSSSSVEPRSESSLTDPIRSINKDDQIDNYGNFYDDVANDNVEADRESVLSDFISSHMVPLPHISADPASEEDDDEEDYISVASSRDANWEDNWLFKKKKSNKTSASVGMLVPAPKEDIRALIGDKPTDEVSDLSEIGSDTDDSSLEMVSASLEPLNDRLVNKHLIGGKNTKTVLDEIVDRTSMISTSSLPDDVPPYTETKNEFVVSNDGLTESENLKISVNNCNKAISNEAINSNVTKTISTKAEKLTKESHVTAEDESIVPPPNDFTDDEKMRNLLAKFNEEQNNKTDSGDDNSSSLSPRSSISCALSAGIDRAELDAYEGITDFCVEDEEGLASEIESSSRRPSVIEILAAIALGPMLAVSASDDRNILTELELSSLMELNELAMAQLNAKASEERRLGVITEESFESGPGEDRRIDIIESNEEADLLSSPKMVMEAIRELVGKDAIKSEITQESSIKIEEITEELESEVVSNLQQVTYDSEEPKNDCALSSKNEEDVEKDILVKTDPENTEEQNNKTEMEKKNTEEILSNDPPNAMKKTEEQKNLEQLEIEETFEIVSGEEEFKEDMIKIETTAQCEGEPKEEIQQEQSEIKNETENQVIKESKPSEDALDEAEISEIKPISNDEDNGITINSLSEDLGFEKVIPEDTSSISDESLHTIGSSSEYSEDLEGDATSFFIDDQNISVTSELSDDQKLQQFKEEIPKTQPIIQTTKSTKETVNEFILPPPTAFCDEQLRKLNEDTIINETVQVTEAHINAETVQAENKMTFENSNNEQETTVTEEQTHNEKLCTETKNESEVKEISNTIRISETEEMTISKEILSQNEKSEEPPDKQSIEDILPKAEIKSSLEISVQNSEIEAENEKLDDSLKVEESFQDEAIKIAEDSAEKKGEQESEIIIEEQTDSSVINEPVALKVLSEAQLTLQEVSSDKSSEEEVPIINPNKEQNNNLNPEEVIKTETNPETLKLEDSPNDTTSEESILKHPLDEISEVQSIEETSNKEDIVILKEEISENIGESLDDSLSPITTELKCELENQKTSNQQELEESTIEKPVETTESTTGDNIVALEVDTVKTEHDDNPVTETLSSENKCSEACEEVKTGEVKNLNIDLPSDSESIKEKAEDQPANIPDNELALPVAEILNSPEEEKVAKSEDEPVENTTNTSEINESITEEKSNDSMLKDVYISSEEPVTETSSDLLPIDKEKTDYSDLSETNIDADPHNDQTKSIEETQTEISTPVLSENVAASEQHSEDLKTETIPSENVAQVCSKKLNPKQLDSELNTEKLKDDVKPETISTENEVEALNKDVYNQAQENTSSGDSVEEELQLEVPNFSKKNIDTDSHDDQTNLIEEAQTEKSTPVVSKNAAFSEKDSEDLQTETVPSENLTEVCSKELNPEQLDSELNTESLKDDVKLETISTEHGTNIVEQNIQLKLEQETAKSITVCEIHPIPQSEQMSPKIDEMILVSSELSNHVKPEEVSSRKQAEMEAVVKEVPTTEDKECEQSSEVLEDEKKTINEETPLQNKSSNPVEPQTADIASVEPFFTTRNINETEDQDQPFSISETETLLHVDSQKLHSNKYDIISVAENTTERALPEEADAETETIAKETSETSEIENMLEEPLDNVAKNVEEHVESTVMLAELPIVGESISETEEPKSDKKLDEILNTQEAPEISEPTDEIKTECSPAQNESTGIGQKPINQKDERDSKNLTEKASSNQAEEVVEKTKMEIIVEPSAINASAVVNDLEERQPQNIHISDGKTVEENRTDDDKQVEIEKSKETEVDNAPENQTDIKKDSNDENLDNQIQENTPIEASIADQATEPLNKVIPMEETVGNDVDCSILVETNEEKLEQEKQIQTTEESLKSPTESSINKETASVDDPQILSLNENTSESEETTELASKTCEDNGKETRKDTNILKEEQQIELSETTKVEEEEIQILETEETSVCTELNCGQVVKSSDGLEDQSKTENEILSDTINTEKITETSTENASEVPSFDNEPTEDPKINEEIPEDGNEFINKQVEEIEGSELKEVPNSEAQIEGNVVEKAEYNDCQTNKDVPLEVKKEEILPPHYGQKLIEQNVEETDLEKRDVGNICAEKVENPSVIDTTKEQTKSSTTTEEGNDTVLSHETKTEQIQVEITKETSKVEAESNETKTSENSKPNEDTVNQSSDQIQAETMKSDSVSNVGVTQLDKVSFEETLSTTAENVFENSKTEEIVTVAENETVLTDNVDKTSTGNSEGDETVIEQSCNLTQPELDSSNKEMSTAEEIPICQTEVFKIDNSAAVVEITDSPTKEIQKFDPEPKEENTEDLTVESKTSEETIEPVTEVQSEIEKSETTEMTIKTVTTTEEETSKKPENELVCEIRETDHIVSEEISVESKQLDKTPKTEDLEHDVQIIMSDEPIQTGDTSEEQANQKVQQIENEEIHSADGVSVGNDEQIEINPENQKEPSLLTETKGTTVSEPEIESSTITAEEEIKEREEIEVSENIPDDLKSPDSSPTADETILSEETICTDEGSNKEILTEVVDEEIKEREGIEVPKNVADDLKSPQSSPTADETILSEETVCTEEGSNKEILTEVVDEEIKEREGIEVPKNVADDLKSPESSPTADETILSDETVCTEEGSNKEILTEVVDEEIKEREEIGVHKNIADGLESPESSPTADETILSEETVCTEEGSNKEILTEVVDEEIKEREGIEVPKNVADDLKSPELSPTADETILSEETVCTEEGSNKEILTEVVDDTEKSEELNSQGPAAESQDKILPPELLVQEEILTDREKAHEEEKSDDVITNYEEASKPTQKSEDIEIKKISPEGTIEEATSLVSDSNEASLPTEVIAKLEEPNSKLTLSAQNTEEILTDDVSIEKTMSVKEKEIEESIHEELISEETNKITSEEVCVVEGSSEKDMLGNLAPTPATENVKDAPMPKQEVQKADKVVELESQETNLDSGDLNLKTDDEKIQSTLNESDLNLKVEDEKIGEIPVVEPTLIEDTVEEQKIEILSSTSSNINESVLETASMSLENVQIGVQETASNENLVSSGTSTTEDKNQITISNEFESQKPTEDIEDATAQIKGADSEIVTTEAEISAKTTTESLNTNSEKINEDKADEGSLSLISSEDIPAAEIIQPVEDAEASNSENSAFISEVTQIISEKVQLEEIVEVKAVLGEASEIPNAEEEKPIVENDEISSEKGDTLKSEEIAEVDNSQELTFDSKNEPNSLEELQTKEVINSSSCSEISPLVEQDITKEEASINQPIATEEPNIQEASKVIENILSNELVNENDESIKTEKPINEPKIINIEVAVDILPESSSETCLQENELIKKESAVNELSVPNEQIKDNSIETTLTNEVTNKLKSLRVTDSEDTTISENEVPTPEIAGASKSEKVVTDIEEELVSAEMVDTKEKSISILQEVSNHSKNETVVENVVTTEEISLSLSKPLRETNDPPIPVELGSDLKESHTERDSVSVKIVLAKESEDIYIPPENQIDQKSLTSSEDIHQKTNPVEKTTIEALDTKEKSSERIIESQKVEEEVTEVKDEPEQTDEAKEASCYDVNVAFEEVPSQNNSNVEFITPEQTDEHTLDKDKKEEFPSIETFGERLNDEESDSEGSFISATEEEFHAENISSFNPTPSEKQTESISLQESEASEDVVAIKSSEINAMPVEVMNQTSELNNNQKILSQEITLKPDEPNQESKPSELSTVSKSVVDVRLEENSITEEKLTNITDTPKLESVDSQNSSVNAIDEKAPAEAENIEKSNNIEAIKTEDTIEPVPDSTDTKVKTEEIQNLETTVIEELPPDIIADISQTQILTENSECIPKTSKTQNEAQSNATDIMLDISKSQDIISSHENDESVHFQLDTDAKEEVNQEIEAIAKILEVSEAVTAEESIDERKSQNIPETVKEVDREKIESIQVETVIEDSNIQIPFSKDTSVLPEEEQSNIEEKKVKIIEPKKEVEIVSTKEIPLSPKEMHEEVPITENIQTQNDIVNTIIQTGLKKTQDPCLNDNSKSSEIEEVPNKTIAKSSLEKVSENKHQDGRGVKETVKEENYSSGETKEAEESQDKSKDTAEVVEEVQAEDASTVKSFSTELIVDPSKSSEQMPTDDTLEFKTTVQSQSQDKSSGEAIASTEISESETPQEDSYKVSDETKTAESTVHDIEGAQTSSMAISTTEIPEPVKIDKNEEIQYQKPSGSSSEEQTPKSDSADVEMAEDNLSEIITEQVAEVEEIPPIEVLTATCKIITHPPLQPTESLIESAQYLYDKISYPVLETTPDISAPNLAEELRMAADRNDNKDASKAERVIPQSIACESRCFTPDPQPDQPIASDSVATEQPNAQDAAQDRISSDSNCTDDHSTTTVIDTFGSMESQSNSDSGEEFSPDGSTDRDSSATATTANNSIITTNKATNQSHIYSPPPLPPQPQPVLRTESACSKLLETRTTGGNEEHVDDDPLKHLVPGSIAEREYKKWYNAVDMPNNPYSAEALRRRLSGGADRALDLPNISPCNEENPLQLCESSATEADNKAQERDYSRYSRDYYINDAKQASGTTKKSPTSPPQVSSPTSTASSIELGERVEYNSKTVETTPVIEMCHKLEKQCRVEADIYLATPVHVIEDIPEAFADKNTIQTVGTITSLTSEAVSKLSSETSSTLTNESLTPSEDSDTIRIYDLKKQETRLIKETTQTTTITVPKSPEKKVRPTELDIMPTLAPPIATVSSKSSTPTSFKFLQPKRKLINPSQVLSIDLDTNPITPSTPEKPVIEAEVAHAMPSVKALAKAFLLTTSTSSSENRWRKARAKSPLQFFKTTTSTSTAATATAAANISKIIQKQPEPVVPDTTSQGSEDATIASDLSSLETDPPSRIDGETLDSNASEDRALSPVVLSGCLRNNIAFFENLKNK